MELQNAKTLITEAKNIYLIPEETFNPEAISSALCLFYTLRELGKNVNIILEAVPDYLEFLTPSLDFISYPKNFVISIPKKTADISQIYYEKNEDSLKIHLTVEQGVVKKEDVSFYFSESKPDLIITLGIKNYREKLENKLNSFGFLLDAPVLNIDNQEDNLAYGKINILDKKSITELTINFLNGLEIKINPEAADCLLTGLVLHTDNFKNFNVTANIFETAATLMNNGADLQKISENICNHKK